MHLSSSTPPKKARIEIIPLIDIMFFLLASFMLVSMSMIKLQAIQNDLPDAHKGENVVKQDFHTIGIDKKGNYYYDKEHDPLSLDLVSTKVQQVLAAAGPDNTKVYINADKDITYNMLIVVLDQLRSLGVKKVSFAVKKGHGYAPPAGAAPTEPSNPKNTTISKWNPCSSDKKLPRVA